MVMKNQTITDNNPNCPWKWIALKHRSESLEAAKDFVNDNFQKLTLNYQFNEL